MRCTGAPGCGARASPWAVLAGHGGERTAQREDDVQAELPAAADLEEDSKRGEDDGEDDLADVAVEEGHGQLALGSCAASGLLCAVTLSCSVPCSSCAARPLKHCARFH